VSAYVPAIRKVSTGKIVLRSHNIEYKLWKRNAEVASNPLKKVYFSFLAERLKKYEEESLHSYDAVAAITKEDAQWFIDNKFGKPLKVIPFGIDFNKVVTEKKVDTEKYSVFHIGAMDWQPNLDGLNWFLNDIWNKVSKAYPDIKLYLAGRKMPEEIIKMSKANIIVIGEVEDAHEFMMSKGLMIVPLLSGGGMRVKIIEGMALGKVIITTTLGAEGINYKNGENILIADTPEEFVNCVISYLESSDHLNSIGKKAKLVAEQQYNNSVICKELTELFDSIRI
jgi:polysaccharide biosynthesis protein PslH